ncbi:UDP-xylose and UDP-N-acetylglucosamine transporter-like [Oppia nitens]|uniref:UDP-xylose and UDP-N-acetylglucosamine transporter-like n=1 Tax=Oppia nitens TaxID=1686743 RepID=UPI0023DB7224|nr:UDP-xylose and UDP-N-acetylglucosamine transporter-like [Oppia nitens]
MDMKSRSSDLKIVSVIALVFMSCGANVVALESIIRHTPGAGNLINLAQIAVISVEGFLFSTRCGRQRSHIPLRHYILLVLHFFVVSLTSSYANVYNMPMPLIMIFRSGSLIANLILGILILKRHYTLTKYLSVIIITIGIIVCTLASIHKPDENNDSNVKPNQNTSFDWTVGILLMLLSLFTSANTGIFQEKLYQKFGKHPHEALFYTHFLQLPGFLLLLSNITQHIVIFTKSEPYIIDLTAFSLIMPKLWLLLLANCLAQYICIRSVFILTAECTSLTVTLVVTIRKFLSLIFSIFYFQNTFTSSHWLGMALVFIGTILFVDIPQRVFKVKTK